MAMIKTPPPPPLYIPRTPEAVAAMKTFIKGREFMFPHLKYKEQEDA